MTAPPHTARWADDLIRDVWPPDGPPLTASRRQAVLAIARLETGFGKHNHGRDDVWNFGNLMCGKRPDGDDCGDDCYVGAGGKSMADRSCWRKFASPEAGMAALVKLCLGKSAIAAVLDSGSAAAVAHGMKLAGYYAEPETVYSPRLVACADSNAKALHEPNALAGAGPTPSRSGSSSSGLAFALAAGLAVLAFFPRGARWA
jgi:hypothetical protein